jgi:peptide/nickel transport system ATP-binding protein
VRHICDRVAVMYLGEIVELGPVGEILQNPQHPYAEALLWATPERDVEQETERPIRTIDIPDPVNPPSGCRFHTRCPEAREVCAGETPQTVKVNGDESHRAACFRRDDDHAYWDSPELTD